MAEDFLRYDKIVDNALRGVVRTTLGLVAENGLPPEHALYLTFRTGHEGVDIPKVLMAEYPDKMTIVLEHQFWNLKVHEDRFEVSLSFHKARQHLVVPFASVTEFADLLGEDVAQFGLKFEATEDDEETAEGRPAAGGKGGSTSPLSTGEVVNLDLFRKK